MATSANAPAMQIAASADFEKANGRSMTVTTVAAISAIERMPR
jgi:hypothetical protein